VTEALRTATLFHDPHIHVLARAGMVESPGTAMHSHDRAKHSGTEGLEMEDRFQNPAKDIETETLELPTHSHDHATDSERTTHFPDPTEVVEMAMRFHDHAEDDLIEVLETTHIHGRAQGHHEPTEGHTRTADPLAWSSPTTYREHHDQISRRGRHRSPSHISTAQESRRRLNESANGGRMPQDQPGGMTTRREGNKATPTTP
jgi:hypothetical protein